MTSAARNTIVEEISADDHRIDVSLRAVAQTRLLTRAQVAVRAVDALVPADVEHTFDLKTFIII